MAAMMALTIGNARIAQQPSVDANTLFQCLASMLPAVLNDNALSWQNVRATTCDAFWA